MSPRIWLCSRLIRRGEPRHSEQGSVTLFSVVAVIGLLVAVGLVADGGGKVRALQQAYGIAEAAARTGAQAIDLPSAIQGQTPTLDPVAAEAAAQEYLAASNVVGTTQVNGNDLTVEVTLERETVFLSLVGINAVEVKASATARLVSGGTGEEAP